MVIRNPRKVYVGNLDRNEARESDLQKLFEKAGRIVQIEFKSGFAFVVCLNKNFYFLFLAHFSKKKISHF